MSRSEVILALKRRLVEIRRRLPPAWQHQAALQAHEAADVLLRKLREVPASKGSWR